jgi:replicative DNA helicase
MSIREFNGSKSPPKNPPGNLVPDGPVYNEIAERDLLMLLINKPEYIPEVSIKISNNEFFSAGTAQLYEAVQLVHHDQSKQNNGKSSKNKLSSILIMEKLRSHNKFGTGPGQVAPEMVVELTTRPCPTAPEYKEGLISTLRDYSARRQLETVAYEARKKARDRSISLTNGLPSLYKMVQDVINWFNENNTQTRFHSFEDRKANYLIRLNGSEEYNPNDPWNQADSPEIANRPKRKLCRTGIEVLDGNQREGKERLVMIKPGHLFTVLADTSVGKSLFAQQVAVHNASQLGCKVLFFANELTDEDMCDREIARFSNVPVFKIQEHREERNVFSKNEWQEIVNTHKNNISKWPGKIDYVEASGMSSDEIYNLSCQADENETLTTGKGYDLVVVDYLQKVKPNQGMRPHGVTTWTEDNATRFSELALGLHIPVLMTSQVSGQRDGGADRTEKLKPGIHSAKNCGAIEERSQVIIGLWRSMEKPREAEIYPLKITNGQRASSIPIPLTFSLEDGTFLSRIDSLD